MHHASKCIQEGTCYPTNHVCAVIDQEAETEGAVEALRAAGFANIRLFRGQEAYTAIRRRSGQDNALWRVWRRVRDLGTEGEIHQLYLATLRRGGSYVLVYASTRDQVDLARAILAAHHAHAIWHLGPWTMERLSEQSPPVGGAQLDQLS
jgi:hypothetical protein